MYKFLGYYIIVNNLNPITFTYENIKSNDKKYIWISHKSYGELMTKIIQDTLIKNNIFKNRLINLPISLENRFFKQLKENLLDISKTNDFDKIYTENDIELLRYYLTLYPQRLIPNLVDQSANENNVLEQELENEKYNVPWQIL